MCIRDSIRIIAQGEYVARSLQDYLNRHPEMDARCEKGGVLIIGLAVAIERILYLSLSTINSKKLITKVEEARCV